MADIALETIDKPVVKEKHKSRWEAVAAVLKSRPFLYSLSVAMFFVTWDVIAAAGLFGMPRVYSVAKYLAVLAYEPLAGKTLLGHLWASMQRVLLGFVIAVAIGVPLGLFMAMNKTVDRIVGPVFNLFKPMPPIAWISIAILWFGIGETSKVFIVLMGTVIPCVINSYNGIRLVDPELYDVIKVLGGNARQEKIYVTFPAAFPAIFAGIQLALSMAWTCVVASELISARSGMGFIIIMGMNVSRTDAIIAGMVVIGMVGWLLAWGVARLEKWVCPWKVETGGV